VTVKLLQFEPLSVAHVNSSVPHPLSLATAAARQQRLCGAKTINNWQVLGMEAFILTTGDESEASSLNRLYHSRPISG